MGKTIVFCADGTWNGPGEPDAENTAAPPTNVYKLFLNIAGTVTADTALLADEQERVLKDAGGAVLQWTKYLHGVGDSSNFLVRLIGGVLGAGLIARIVRGYTFISRNYVPGDRIFITGFSRGAYTARALAGMIASKGLLDATKNDLADKENAYRMGSAVWYAYRRAGLATDPVLVSKLANLTLDLPAFLAHLTVPDSQLVKAPIEVVAVWDTVGSLGIPTYTLQQSRYDVFQFADTALSQDVNHGIHALALDERRADFTPTLWDPDPRILQMVFVGCHSDVGGGFVSPGAESGLQDCGLQWMTDRLAEHGVTFVPQPVYVPQPDPSGTAHQTWLTGIWSDLPKEARYFPPDVLVSDEVRLRMAAPSVLPDPSLPPGRYDPPNLPQPAGASGPKV